MKNTLFTLTVVLLMQPMLLSAAEPIDIGSRRELFLDRYLIDRLSILTRELRVQLRRDGIDFALGFF